MDDELFSLLDEIKASDPEPQHSPKRERVLHKLYPALDLPHDTKRWKPEDKQAAYQLSLSPYEKYWLQWRLSVHLRSYAMVEWSEMKEVLTNLLTRLESLDEGLNRQTEGGSNDIPTTPEQVLSEGLVDTNPHALSDSNVCSSRDAPRGLLDSLLEERPDESSSPC